MKHYEPGGNPPRKKSSKKNNTIYLSGNGAGARREARRRQIRRNRMIFTLLMLSLVVMIGGLITFLIKDSDSKPKEPVSSSSSAEPAPTPTPEPTPVPFVPTWDTTGEENMPYLVAVNRQTQTVTVYEKDEAGNYTVPHSSMICSSGDDTELGFFHTSNQYTWRALYGNVYGQYATRIDGPILFHSVPYLKEDKSTLEAEEFNKLGTPASLGCIRLQIKDCKWIYDNCPSGTPVVIFDGDETMDPLGNPGFDPIDVNSPNAGWDPTDPDPANPWNSAS